MASIERTAYPRFKSALTAHELDELYCPAEEDLEFVYKRADDPTHRLTVLAQLKCHQHLGYLPALDEIPDQVRAYLCYQLALPSDTTWMTETKTGRYRQHQVIRSHLGSDIHVMLDLRLRFQKVIVANEILDGADVIGQLLGKRQRTAYQT